ncbi:MAG: YitT family protein [Ramlibacter sp.]
MSLPLTVRPVRHRPLEDLQALLTGALLAAVGLCLFQQAGLLAGGTSGLALVLSYQTGWSLSLAMLLCNAPFYALACFRMGFEFTLKTLAVITLTALFVQFVPGVLVISHVAPWAAAVFGGLLIGIGMLALFRHRASLGGINVVVLYLQERFGWRAGKVQLLLDAAILAGGWLATGAPPVTAASSILAAVIVNLVLVANLRADRYRAA